MKAGRTDAPLRGRSPPRRADGAGRAAPRRRQRFVLCGMLALLIGAPAAAQERLESDVKAAYLYKFPAYVQWPATASGTAAEGQPAVIGVAGDDAVLAALQEIIAGRAPEGRGMVARKIAAGDPLDTLNVLYVGGKGNEPRQLQHALMKGRPVLLVTDNPAGIKEGGGMLNFILVDGRVRFEASVPAAEQAGLKLSARLLAVAERVVPP